MHEALQRVLAYLFGTLHLHRVEAEIDPRNAPPRTCSNAWASAARECCASAGASGRLADSAVYGLLADDKAAAALPA